MTFCWPRTGLYEAVVLRSLYKSLTCLTPSLAESLLFNMEALEQKYPMSGYYYYIDCWAPGVYSVNMRTCGGLGMKISNDRPVSRRVPYNAFDSLTQRGNGLPVAETRKRPSWQKARSG